jgi:hypothetical protein
MTSGSPLGSRRPKKIEKGLGVISETLAELLKRWWAILGSNQ